MIAIRRFPIVGLGMEDHLDERGVPVTQAQKPYSCDIFQKIAC
jgi:hypothetical protein